MSTLTHADGDDDDKDNNTDGAYADDVKRTKHVMIKMMVPFLALLCYFVGEFVWNKTMINGVTRGNLVILRLSSIMTLF